MHANKMNKQENCIALEEAGERIDAIKGKKYSKYVKYVHINRYEIAKQIMEKGMKEMKKTSKSKILDLGCGLGYGSKIVITPKSSGKIDYIGCDMSFDSLLYSKKEHDLGNVVVADCNYLPFKDASFDFIFFLEVIEHIESCQRALNQIGRCLRKGGLLFISTPNRKYLPRELYGLFRKKKFYFSKFHRKEYSFKEFKSLLSFQKGFRVLEIRGQDILPLPVGNFLIDIMPESFHKYLVNLGKFFSSQAAHFIAILEKD